MTATRKPQAFRTVQIPAHTDYTVTMVRPNGERLEHYVPYVYRTTDEAQRECDRLNQRANKRGRAEVTATDRPAGVGYRMRLPLSKPAPRVSDFPRRSEK